MAHVYKERYAAIINPLAIIQNGIAVYMGYAYDYELRKSGPLVYKKIEGKEVPDMEFFMAEFKKEILATIKR